MKSLAAGRHWTPSGRPIKLVPRSGIEPLTSSLPMKRTTTVLTRRNRLSHISLLAPVTAEARPSGGGWAIPLQEASHVALVPFGKLNVQRLGRQLFPRSGDSTHVDCLD